MTDKVMIALVCILLQLTGRSSGSEEISKFSSNVVCKPVAGMFGPMAGEKNSMERGILPVQLGPTGPIGNPGKDGVKGPMGEPDYNKVSKIVERKVKTLNDRLSNVESSVKELMESDISVRPSSSGHVQPTNTPEAIKNAQACKTKFNSPISVNQTCYRLIGGEGIHWIFEYAESNCTKLGGYLADLDSREAYDKIYDYIDKTYSTVVTAWTGMRYENDKLLLTSGNHASFTKWMAYNPRISKNTYSSYYKTYTHVYVNIDTSSRTNGLRNTPSTRKLPYALCHFDLSPSATTRRSTTTQTTTTESDDYYDLNYYA